MDELKRIALKKIEVAAVAAIDPYVLDAHAETLKSYYADRFELSVRGYILAEEDSLRRVEIHYPATWWQHFKQRFFPKWALKRWPVKEMVHRVDVEAIYPMFTPKMAMRAARLLVIDKFAHPAWD